LRARNRFVQGYNAQAAVSEDQVIVAAALTNAANDTTMFVPMVDATEANLQEVGRPKAVGAYAADAGYWSVANVTHSTDADVLIVPIPATNGVTDPHDPRLTQRNEILDRHERGKLTLRAAAREMGVTEVWARRLRDDRRRGTVNVALLRQQMLDRLDSPDGKARYSKRKITAEPVFGNIKANLRFRRFSRRGRHAALSEWRLICSTHNLLKLRAVRLAGP
jgi:hypothetical protein